MGGDSDSTWRDEKAKTNLKNHKTDFQEVSLVFEDLRAFERIDDRMNYGEERLTIVGMVRGRLLAVTYTDGPDGRPHLISARKANRKEHNDYYQG